MELYVKISFISIFYLFFRFSNMIFFRSMILPISQFQIQKLTTSQIRSHIEYLMQTYHILVLIL